MLGVKDKGLLLQIIGIWNKTVNGYDTITIKILK